MRLFGSNAYGIAPAVAEHLAVVVVSPQRGHNGCNPAWLPRSRQLAFRTHRSLRVD